MLLSDSSAPRSGRRYHPSKHIGISIHPVPEGVNSISRRASFPLRAGHKVAYMYTESTEYSYLQNVNAAKMWFKANVDRIMDIYGVEHNVHREDLFLGACFQEVLRRGKLIFGK